MQICQFLTFCKGSAKSNKVQTPFPALLFRAGETWPVSSGVEVPITIMSVIVGLILLIIIIATNDIDNHSTTSNHSNNSIFRARDQEPRSCGNSFARHTLKRLTSGNLEIGGRTA